MVLGHMRHWNFAEEFRALGTGGRFLGSGTEYFGLIVQSLLYLSKKKRSVGSEGV
jgi:hypothetical protein